MGLGPLRLHHRIVVPFALVAVVTTAGAAYFTLTVTERALQSRVEAQVRSAATVVSQSDFATNPNIVQSVKAIAGADILTYRIGVGVLATTLDADQDAALVAAVIDPLKEGMPNPGTMRRIDCGGACYAAYHRVSARPDTIVAVVSRANELAAAEQVVTRTIVATALLSIVAMIVVSQLVARRVTAPLDALVRFTRDISSGQASQRAPVGEDEVGRLGEAFNEMLDRLDRSQGALVQSEKLALAGLFAARVAHDIRNPLSSIKMQTQLLRTTFPSGEDKRRSILDAVQRDIVQVESVVNDLLELAKPGRLRLEPIALNNVVNEVVEQIAPHLTYRKIQIDRRLAEDVPSIPLDAQRFKQALLNVVNNAADAMPAGGTLTIETRRSDGAVELDVCDDGEGVPAEILDRVFDPFVTTKRDGVGLGLVNTKAVVESHGGRVELAPRVPRGTRARIWLPTPA